MEPEHNTTPPPTEALLEAFLTDRVRRAGGFTFKMAPTHKGLPDRLVILPNGHIALVEMKTPTGRLSPAQAALHRRLAALGAHVVVLRSKGEILSWLHSAVSSPPRWPR